MVKELRLGFAMGGGVSLGAFSGIALTEAIKLALAYSSADRVVVDVFSGASAGAMSLGLMLRTLAHASDDDLDQAETEVAAELTDVFGNLSPERGRDLAAAHYAQKIQQRVWEAEITLDRLLGNGTADLTHSAGILDRGAVESIAAAYLALPDDSTFSKRRLLGDRVLFAATLSNLTPLVADGTDGNDPALIDGMTSRIHRDLRVFDLRFSQVDPAHLLDVVDPPSWCRYHLGPKTKNKIDDLRTQRAWAKIAATSIAAGAFPFAFGPVVLTRNRWEFPFGWPEALPKGIGAEFPFTYVDGGVFNNEPIREAFRLAAFLDAQEMNRPPDQRAEITRRIIFVDPNVDAGKVSLRMPLHRRWFLQAPNVFGSLDGIDLEQQTTLEQLIPTAISIAGAVFDEANVVEADKIRDVRDLFDRRDDVRAMLDDAFVDNPSKRTLEGMLVHCANVLEANRQNQRIPASGLHLAQELERVIAERGWVSEIGGRSEHFVNDGQRHEDPHARLWLKALIFLLLDLQSGLVGKRDGAMPIAIAPVTGNKVVPLPGGALAGFAGFASHANARFERELARRATTERLLATGLIQDAPLPDLAPMSEKERSDFKEDVEAGLEKLGDRVSQILNRSHLELVFPGLDRLILRMGGKFLRNIVGGASIEAPAQKWRFELRVAVPDRDFELDGKGFGDQDIHPVQEGDTLFLITFADFDPVKEHWEGPHLDDAGQHLLVDGDGSRHAIKLPTKVEAEKAQLTPNPIFVHCIGKTGWATEPGVVPLEATLFPQ